MSNCTNCFNGCTEIVSDRCVRYTGIDVPALGITTGDTLSSVESSIVNFLVPVLTGVGIKPIIDDNIICDLVRINLPTCTTCTGFTLNDVLSAIIKSICDLQGQIETINDAIDTLNADYTIGCLTGVTASSGTHTILQTVITKLCLVDVNLGALTLELQNQYSSNGVELDNYIANYLLTHSANTSLICNRMVPYGVIEYYGTLANFTGSGAGIGNWANIYLCNGQNGTPDKRGRVGVGVTVVPGGGGYPPQTDPALGNPNYFINSSIGQNFVQLALPQIPSHSHSGSYATTIISPNPHNHAITPQVFTTGTYPATTPTAGTATTPILTTLASENILLTAATTVTILPSGSNESHQNYQPGLGCYYIMYIPAP